MVLRAKPEKKEEKERVALALLRATLRLATAHGFAGLGLREVSREADIAPTSFYRHFGDMEELGLALIRDLVERSVVGWVERAQAAAADGKLVEELVRHVLIGVSEDPQLMRFVLAERVGAVPSFRAALRDKLSTVSAALHEALAAELGVAALTLPTYLSEAALVLLLEACAQALDQPTVDVATLRERVLMQLRLLRGGADVVRKPT